MSELPVARTTTDDLLTALHREVVGLRADLKAARDGEPAEPDSNGRVELTEPGGKAPARRAPRRT